MATFLLVKSKASNMLPGVNWKQMTGIGLIAGIGFTMSIFIASLSFTSGFLSDTSKLAIIGGSLIAGIAGLIFLSLTLKPAKEK